MKLKGINKFEQHLEKIVLGVSVIGLLAIVGWQFLSPPSFKLGSRSVQAGEVDALLEVKANALLARLNDSEKSDIEIPTDTVKLAAPDFSSAIKGPITPVESLARTAPNFNGALVKDAVSAVDIWYFEPTVPALQMRGVQETADALTADSAKDAAKVSKILAARPDFQKIEGPKDVVWTTPLARIDLKRLRAELADSRKDATPPLMAIPGVWYQETPYVVDIAFERRERADDGSWGTPVVVPVFANRADEITFRGRIENAAADVRDEVFALLGSDDNQKEILQPTFYETVNGAFVSPMLLADAGEGAASASGADAGATRRNLQLQTQLQDKQRRALTLRGELEKLGGVFDEEAERKKEEERKKDERDQKEAEKAGSKGGGKGGSGPGGGPGGSMSGKNNSSAGDDLKDAKRKLAERKTKSAVLQRVEAEIAALVKSLGAASGAGAGGPAVKAPTLGSLDELLVWGHDLEVMPGHTYQYRCVARVYNPFFGKGNQLVQKQADKGLASQFTIDSAASEWSTSITVSPDVRFFVTRAIVADGSLALGSAQVEVYKLLGGQWRKSETSVQPGERIGRIDNKGAQPVDFTTQYFVIDVVEDLDTSRGPSTAGKDRRPGLVVVGSITGTGTEVRFPYTDYEAPDRLKLRAQADAAAPAGSDSKDAPANSGPGGDKPKGPGSGGAGGGNKPGTGK
jgi:hypothetical protein